jgi:REP element-mobilizing transposase RayT
MPHRARTRSGSGFYHVVPKGIGDQIIFEDDDDRTLYVQLLAEAKRETGIKLHAYCLMSNHTHLVVQGPHDTMSAAMKYVHERYAKWYAEKIGRTGGILRKPFWSEPIEKDEYLLCAVRYVHANPANALICKAAAYEWSSAKDYLGRVGIADTSMVLDMLGGRKGFIEFSQPKNSTLLPFPKSRLSNHESDDEMLQIARVVLGENPHLLITHDKATRDRGIALLASRGFARNQIMRLTGAGRRTVERCMARNVP